MERKFKRKEYVSSSHPLRTPFRVDESNNDEIAQRASFAYTCHISCVAHVGITERGGESVMAPFY